MNLENTVIKINEKVREHVARWPSLPIYEAAKYALLTGGKRIRPLLAVASYETVGGRGDEILDYALALEMVHTSSLIVDDLPCMDNDDLRRGLPTCHKVYGEATALQASQILVYDGLKLVKSDRCLREYLDTIGSLIVGQFLEDPDGKTGSLITLSTRIGGIIGGATESQLDALTQYGRTIGYLFQVVDDIIDGERPDSKLYAELSCLDIFGIESEALRRIAYIILERRV